MSADRREGRFGGRRVKEHCLPRPPAGPENWDVRAGKAECVEPAGPGAAGTVGKAWHLSVLSAPSPGHGGRNGTCLKGCCGDV